MSTTIHTLHVVLAGVWLGGVVFTTVVVSPALKAMKWGEAERVKVRSVIGGQYARVGTVNLGLLLIFAVLDGLLKGFSTILYTEYVLLAVVFGLVATYGAYFGRRLTRLSGAPRAPMKLVPSPKSAARSRGPLCEYLSSISSLVCWSRRSLPTCREHSYLGICCVAARLRPRVSGLNKGLFFAHKFLLQITRNH